jgi:hypothetical protein
MAYHPGPSGSGPEFDPSDLLPRPFDLCSLPSVDADSDEDESKDSDPYGTWLSELADETIRQFFGPIPFIATAPKQYFELGPGGDTDSVFLPRAEDLIRSVARSTPPSVVNIEVELNPLSSMLTFVSEVDQARAASRIDSLPRDSETLYPSPMIRERFEPPSDDEFLALARTASNFGRESLSSIVTSPQGGLRSVRNPHRQSIDVPQSIDVAHELWKRARRAEWLRLMEQYISSYFMSALVRPTTQREYGL